MAGILATLLKQWTGDCANRLARLKADVKPTSESRAIATFAGTLLGVVKQNPKTIPSVLTAAVAFCGLVYQYWFLRAFGVNYSQYLSAADFLDVAVKSIPLSLAIATALLGVLATVSVCALLIRLLLVRVGRPLLVLLRLGGYCVARAALLTGILAIAAGWELPRRGSSARRIDPEALLRLCRIRTRTLRHRFLGVTQQLTGGPQAAWTAVKSRPPTPPAASGLDARLLSGGLAVALIPALLGTLVGLFVAQEVRRELPEMMQAAEQAEKPVSITRAPVAAGRPPTRLCTAKPQGAGRSMPPAMVSEHGWLAALGAPLPSFLLDWLVADYTHALALKLRGIEGEVTGVARLGATASHTFLYCLPYGPAIVVPTDAVEAIAGTAALPAAFRWPRSDWEEPPATALERATTALTDAANRLAAVAEQASGPKMVALASDPVQRDGGLPRGCRAGRVSGAEFRFALGSARLDDHATLPDIGRTVAEHNRDALEAVRRHVEGQSPWAADDYLLLVGQTDLSGRSDHNALLSERRAANVMAALAAGHGWTASDAFADWPGIGPVSRSLRSIGLGETATAWREDPADPRNRRVLVYHCMIAGPEQEALPLDQEAAADLPRQST